MKSHLTRRNFLATGAAASIGTAAYATSVCGDEKEGAAQQVAKPNIPGKYYKIAHGRIRHSVMGWCFNPMPTPELIDACHAMGMTAMEGISAEHYPRLKELGMKPSLIGSHGFKDGPANPKHRENCVQKLREGIDLAVEYGAPGVITFTGMREKDLSDKQMADNCVACWKEIIGYAEEKGINLCLEHLNTRDDTHPMKGHPGYFGDDVD
jgi:hydroxypyruvate isomerase